MWVAPSNMARTAIPFLLLVVAMAGDGQLRLSLVWKRDLGKIVHEIPGTDPHAHTVFGLKMSDNELWIGVDLVADHTIMWAGQHHHLLLVPSDSVNNSAEQYEFQQRPGMEDNFFLPSDGGLVLIADGQVIRLEDRRLHSSCSVSPINRTQALSPGGFINDELFLATRWYPTGSPKEKAQYELYNRDCKLTDSWEMQGGVPAMSWPVEGQALIRRYIGGTTWETLLVEWPSWTIVKKWPFQKGGLAAEGGRVLCGMFLSDHFQCRVMATDEPLSNPIVIHYGMPMAASRSGTLAVGTDWFALWKPFTEGDYWAHVRHEVLWNFRLVKLLPVGFHNFRPRPQARSGAWVQRSSLFHSSVPFRLLVRYCSKAAMKRYACLA
jgi:hypothetical protein